MEKTSHSTNHNLQNSGLLSIVIPIFNNCESLRELNTQVIEMVRTNAIPVSEIIYVDDGSQDSSVQVLTEIQIQSEIPIKIVELAANFGQPNAILAGIDVATSKYVTTISADLQDPPELIARMYQELTSYAVVVIGERVSRDDSILVRFGSFLTYFVMRLSNSNIPKGGFDCWMTETNLAKIVLSRSNVSVMKQLDFFSLGLEVRKVKYHRSRRPYGKSGYSFRKKVKMFIEILVIAFINSATYMVLLGLLVSVLSLVMFLIVLFGYFTGDSPFKGFTFISGMVILLGSFSILILGSILTLISRMAETQNHNQRYLVKKISSQK